jgi:hypothetical protein
VHLQPRQALFFAIDHKHQVLRIGAAHGNGAPRDRGLHAPFHHRVIDRLVLA